MELTNFQEKPVYISTHAIKQARIRRIAFPDYVKKIIEHGKIKRFGKNLIQFKRRNKKGSVIIIVEDIGAIMIIKTVERGN